MTRTSAERLKDALTHFDMMQTYAQRDLADQLVIDAVCMRLSAGLEALSGLEPVRREELFGETWQLTWGMRNRIAHGYLLVDSAIIRRTLERDIPPIMDRIRNALWKIPAFVDTDLGGQLAEMSES